VKVDPIKLTLKAPGSTRVKVKCDVLVSGSAFNFKLRRYSTGVTAAQLEEFLDRCVDKVRRCRLTLSNPR
jgi:hypothetical protein